ncbi:MAG: hypothetical protein U5M51_16625 [Emticicia sp.]|nr:hypothetical protein [Emticicia sp.]
MLRIQEQQIAVQGKENIRQGKQIANARPRDITLAYADFGILRADGKT